MDDDGLRMLWFLARRAETGAGPFRRAQMVGTLLVTGGQWIRQSMAGACLAYCLTVSLAGGGVGLGALGAPARSAPRACPRRGFAQVRQVPIDDPFNNLYELA